MGRERGLSSPPPPRKNGGSRDESPCGKKAREEENAMKNVLRMLSRSPNLPAPYLDIARGIMLLVSDSTDRKVAAARGGGAPAAHEANKTTPEDEARERKKAARILDLDRDGLRRLALSILHQSARWRSWKTLGSLRATCKQASPELKRIVLAHLRSVENPSQVCRDLGTIVNFLISELGLAAEEGVEEAQNNTTGNKDDTKGGRDPAGLAHGLNASVNNSGSETVDGDANAAGTTGRAKDSARSPDPNPTLVPTMHKALVEQLQARARRVRSKSAGASTRSRRLDSGGGEDGPLWAVRIKPVAPRIPSTAVREGRTSLQQPGGRVRLQLTKTNIQEKCKEVLQKIELVASLVDDVTQGKDDATQENKTAMQDMQEILNDISGAPVAHGGLHLEDDIFEAIKQLLAWKPPPKGKRDRSRYNAQLARAAGVLLKKALIPEGPTGFWPLPRPSVSSGTRVPKKARAFGVKVALFRRKKGLREAAGGGARSSGRTKHGVWSFSACSFRYASKPAVPPSALDV